MKKYYLVLFYLLLANITLTAQIIHRLDKDWEFVRQDLGGIWEAIRPVTLGAPETVPIWEQISLPHSFNQLDAVQPDVNYYQGAGWYRTKLKIDNPYQNGRIILHFLGAGQKSNVYVYDQLVGSHVGGYDEWKVDITDAVSNFKKNHKKSEEYKGLVPISIRVDNTRDLELMPSDLSDFNVYGGLYRPVHLIYTPALHAEYVFANVDLSKNNKSATVNVRTRLWNLTSISQANIQVILKDKAGKEVYKSKQTLVSTNTNDIHLPEFKIESPLLWSPDQPNLYTLELKLMHNGDTSIHTEKIGFRHFEFIQNGPFHLNGKRLLLRGTHRHEDHANVGPAMSEELIWKEMRMMKDMGVNFIRLGHYQQSRTVLEACDELGILVWEEIPWCRGGLGGEIYQQQGKRMLTNMIEQHYNHPSVIIWGLGNENDWPGDFQEFDKEKIRTYMKELHDLSHQLDASRKTAIRRCDFCKDIVDVYSPSIWAGWYRGQYTDYKIASENEFKKVNHFLHVEWGGDSHARRHAELPDQGISEIINSTTADERAGDASLYGGPSRVSKDGDWSESYIVNLIDWHLKEQETMPWLSGTAYWPFKDFSTPVRPENPVPYVNQKGVVERNLNKKESYYVFQSYWTESPMIHIYGHSWPVRWGDKGQDRMVKVYSNCEEVELFLNGISQGKRKRNSQDFPAAGLRWMVKFEEGKNDLKAVGIKDGKQIVDNISPFYQTQKWSQPAQLSFEIIEQKKDTLLLEAYLLDEKGVKCLDSRDYIDFEVAGDGYLIVDQGTSDGSKRLQAYNGRALVRLVRTGADVVAFARSEGLPSAMINISSTNKKVQVQHKLQNQILENAKVALNEPIKTITSSICERSAGGPNDFYSEGDYWWPNPANPYGPYIRKDGMTNPQNFVDHRNLLMRFGDIVGTLISAWKISGEQHYIDVALQHINAWFVDEKTKMNPSLLYAQAIKGVATGRGIGIIDGIHLIEVAQSLHLLKESNKLPAPILHGTSEWFNAYLQWLQTHPYGIEEREAKNNHGTCWLMQVAAFAKYVDDKDLLAFCVDRYTNVVLPNQMAVDGSFSLELVRTKPYGYSLFNLDAFATICFILKDFDRHVVDMQVDGKSLYKGISFIYPFVQDKSKWPYPKDVMYDENWPIAQPFLLFGGLLYNQPQWLDTWMKSSLNYTVDEVKRNSPIRHPLIWI